MLNWEPAWYYKVGATRYFDNGWSLSAGYIYSENAIAEALHSAGRGLGSTLAERRDRFQTSSF